MAIKNRAPTPLKYLESELLLRYSRAEQALNAAHTNFQVFTSNIDRVSCNTLLQTRLFRYEIEVQPAPIFHNGPTGFSRVIALEGPAHKAVESNNHMNKRLIPEMLRWAKEGQIPSGERQSNDLKPRETFKTTASWGDARNNATGYCDSNVEVAVGLLDAMDFCTRTEGNGSAVGWALRMPSSLRGMSRYQHFVLIPTAHQHAFRRSPDSLGCKNPRGNH